MFTVKLQRGHIMRIVEAETVEVFPAGPLSKIADELGKRDNQVREISVVTARTMSVFYVAMRRCWAHEAPNNGHNVYDCAYIENQNGATTEVIRPF